MIRLGNNEVLKSLTKTLTFVNADANGYADADARGSIIALRERCSGELEKSTDDKKAELPSMQRVKEVENLQSVSIIFNERNNSCDFCSFI